MDNQPCNVCSSTDGMTLVDGFYYCVECGTQDTNLQLTILDNQKADGTVTKITAKKIKKTKTQNAMSPEWHKWHAYNFVLKGLADEVISLGAKEDFEEILLWMWVKYVKKYRNYVEECTQNKLFTDEDITNEKPNDTKDSDQKGKQPDLEKITIGMMHAMCAVALNLMDSDIQFMDMFRFIKEKKITHEDCAKFIPEEADPSGADNWLRFVRSWKERWNAPKLRLHCYALFQQLDIGEPRVPNILKLVERYILELGLPNGFREVVYSIMQVKPVFQKCSFDKYPHYEGMAMCYILCGLKICFGLDDRYENELSDIADKINAEENRPQAYQFEESIEKTNRLFSFREWVRFIEYRKIILAKYYLPYHLKLHREVNAQLFVSETNNRFKRQDSSKLSDNIIMDIIGKIPADIDSFIKPKVVFPSTLTPLTTFSKTILHSVYDADIKQLMWEEFQKYSLDYITKYSESCGSDIVSGVKFSKFNIKTDISEGLRHTRFDKTPVFVRNCENKHWLTTNTPKGKHINFEDVAKENHENEAISLDQMQSEKTLSDQQSLSEDEDKITHNIFEFDDFLMTTNSYLHEFKDYDEKILNTTTNTINATNNSIVKDDDTVLSNNDPSLDSNLGQNHPYETNVQNLNDTHENNFDDLNDTHENNIDDFNPDTFNREEAIKVLLDVACNDFNIQRPKPKSYDDNRQLQPINSKPYKPRDRPVSNTHKEKRKSRREEVNDILGRFHLIQMQEKLNSLMQSVREEINQGIPDIGIEIQDLENSHMESKTNSFLDTDDDVQLVEGEGRDTDDCLKDNIPDDVQPLSPDQNDPKFDEKYYDVSQMYLKYKPREEDEVSIGSSDGEVKEMIINKLASFKAENIDDFEEDDGFWEKDDDKPLSHLIQKNESTNLFKVKNHYYWSRIYTNINRSRDNQRRFEKDLVNFPKSFVWALELCASMIEAKTENLYNQFMTFEKNLTEIATDVHQTGKISKHYKMRVQRKKTSKHLNNEDSQSVAIAKPSKHKVAKKKRRKED